MELLRLSIIIVLFALANSVPVDDDHFVYLASTNKFYKYVGEKHFFREHEILCQSMGAHVWIPNSGQEVIEVMEIFQKREFDSIWLGILERKGYGLDGLLDLHGRSDYYRNWGRENITKNDQIVVVDKNGKYFLNYALDQHYTICEIAEMNSHPSNVSVSDDYTRIDQFDASYKFDSYGTDVRFGQLKCLRDGATFWVPESEEEVKAVYDIIIPPEYDEIIIGVHNHLMNGFISIDGRRDYYTNWLTGHPLIRQFDTIVHRNGSYETGNFVRKFVCKKSFKQNENPINEHSYSYNTETNAFYKIFTKKLNFSSAGKICEQDKGSLITFPVDYNLHAYSTWLGYRKISPKQYISINGDIVDINESSNQRQGCGLVNYKRELSVTNCGSEHQFLCQINGNSLEFTYPSKTGARYLFVPYSINWHKANYFCNKRNATLLTFRTEDEPLEVMEMMPSNMAPSYIGYFKMSDTEEIMSSRGFNISSLDKMKWEQAPISEEYCLGLTKAGMLVALNCHQPHSLVCKME